MSLLLKEIIGDWNAYKIRNIIRRAKEMDTSEIYDELFGIKPPLPLPACERLKDMRLPWWVNSPGGFIWSPDGNHRHVEPGRMDLSLLNDWLQREDIAYRARMRRWYNQPHLLDTWLPILRLDAHEMGSMELQLAGLRPLDEPVKYDQLTPPPTWDLESWRKACDKAIKDGSGGQYRLYDDVPLKPDYRMYTDSNGNQIWEMSADIRVAIRARKGRRVFKPYTYKSKPWKYRHRPDSLHAFQKSKYHKLYVQNR